MASALYSNPERSRKVQSQDTTLRKNRISNIGSRNNLKIQNSSRIETGLTDWEAFLLFDIVSSFGFRTWNLAHRIKNQDLERM
jgi:hypothetical protein